jgi:L-rhamnose-H+ transport protein
VLWLILAVASGVLNGSFTLPMKYTRKWKWEHTWGIWSVWALLILPLLIVLFTVPDFEKVYSGELGRLLLVFIIGCGWGIGAITFGMGVHYLGIALGFAIIMGITTSVGSLIPLILVSSDSFQASVFFSVITGVLLMVLGIGICSLGGHLRDKRQNPKANLSNSPGKTSFVKGLLICVIAGLTGPCINFAFIAGAPLIEKAINLGASSMFAANVIWAIALPGGFLVTSGYCCYIIHLNKNKGLFCGIGTKINWFLAMCMGLAWTGSIVLYGIATTKFGRLGPAVCWAAFLGMAIITGNFWGIVTGEWKRSGKKPLLLMFAGVALVLLGICTLGLGKV